MIVLVHSIPSSLNFHNSVVYVKGIPGSSQQSEGNMVDTSQQTVKAYEKRDTQVGIMPGENRPTETESRVSDNIEKDKEAEEDKVPITLSRLFRASRN